MKHLFKSSIYLVLTISLMACNSYKSAKKSLLSGHYDKVITQMTNKYKKGVKEKNKKKLVSLLQEAYIKANTRDLEMVDRYKQSKGTEKYKSIYLSYKSIQDRQDRIKPLLPISLHGRDIEFPIEDYSGQVEKYKRHYANQLNKQSSDLMRNPSKPNAQKAYGLLKTLESLYPDYRNLQSRLNNAYVNGTTFVYVAVRNNSEFLMPKVVDENLRLLDTKYLNRNWKEFHSELERGIEYDYDVLFDVQDIIVSPEMVSRNRFVSEKEIIDGWEYQKDENGNFVLDSLDQKVKVDIIKNIRAEVRELHHNKHAIMKAKVAIINNATNRIESTRSFESNIFFSDFSCRVTGDEAALEEDYRKTIKTRILPFPTDTEILMDCSEDVKSQVRTFLKTRF